jgi:hypothetical protein
MITQLCGISKAQSLLLCFNFCACSEYLLLLLHCFHILPFNSSSKSILLRHPSQMNTFFLVLLSTSPMCTEEAVVHCPCEISGYPGPSSTSYITLDKLFNETSIVIFIDSHLL